MKTGCFITFTEPTRRVSINQPFEHISSMLLVTTALAVVRCLGEVPLKTVCNILVGETLVKTTQNCTREDVITTLWTRSYLWGFQRDLSF